MSETVKVAIRCRPYNSNEKESQKQQIVQVDESRREIFIYNPKKEQKKQFTFDYTYGMKSE